MDIKRRDFIKGAAAVAATSSAGLGCEAESSQSRPHRWINQDKCIGCGRCVPLCPMGAISLSEKSSIDPDECAECGVCWRSGVCPVEAITPGELEWPRVLREVFSNPLAEHEATGVAGRGTEGIKTNDVTGRYKRGYMGVFVELGRPVLGARLYDVEKVLKKFRAHGYKVVDDNPIAGLVADSSTGALEEEVLYEKVISALVEFILPEGAADELMSIMAELEALVETVMNLSVALPARPDGSSPLYELFGKDVWSLANGKVNIGIAEDIG